MRTRRSPPPFLRAGDPRRREGAWQPPLSRSLLRKEEPEPSLPATAPSVTHVSFKTI